MTESSSTPPPADRADASLDEDYGDDPIHLIDDTLDPELFSEDTPFGPVPVRYRHDGWVPERQTAFIAALAEGGCVEAAARSVGMTRASAYALRGRIDAQAFRLAWEAATDAAVTRLADAALARAIDGVAVPIFHAGEQVGERRHFDERLTMFLLRYREPTRYGKWTDRVQAYQHQDGIAMILIHRALRAAQAAWRMFDAALHGEPIPDPRPERVTPGRPIDA